MQLAIFNSPEPPVASQILQVANFGISAISGKNEGHYDIDLQITLIRKILIGLAKWAFWEILGFSEVASKTQFCISILKKTYSLLLREVQYTWWCIYIVDYGPCNFQSILARTNSSTIINSLWNLHNLLALNAQTQYFFSFVFEQDHITKLAGWDGYSVCYAVPYVRRRWRYHLWAAFPAGPVRRCKRRRQRHHRDIPVVQWGAVQIWNA